MAIKWGVIGSGPWGTKVASAIKALGFECQPCDRHGAFQDVERLIKWSDIVFIAAHPKDHCDLAGRCLLRNKVTIVEKPVGFYAEPVKELVALSRETNTPFIVDYTYLFNPGVQALKRPDLRSLTIKMGSNGPVRDYSALWDWGSHAVAIVLDFIREPLTGIAIHTNPSCSHIVDLGFETKSAHIEASNAFVERTVKIEANCACGDGYSGTPNSYPRFEDNDRYNKTTNPLASVISTAARLHLRSEYWTNGDLAVEVTDLLERLHAMLPK